MIERTPTKAERAHGLRYKKPALMSLGYDAITNELYEIVNACTDIHWFMENDEKTLINALDGDEEDEYEFRMAFSDLEGKAERLNNALQDYDVKEYFDDATVALIGNRYSTTGYDSVEEDYYALTSFEGELAFTESGKKLMRRTKAEMLSIIGQCTGITLAFFDLRHNYDYLKATMDILRDENTSLLMIIKEIEAAYEVADESGDYRDFDALLRQLPDRAWLD